MTEENKNNQTEPNEQEQAPQEPKLDNNATEKKEDAAKEKETDDQGGETAKQKVEEAVAVDEPKDKSKTAATKAKETGDQGGDTAKQKVEEAGGVDGIKDKGKEAATKAKAMANQGVDAAKQKFKEAGGVDGLKDKGKNVASEIKAGFVPDKDSKGFKSVLSRIKNLWKKGKPGKIVILATVILVLLILRGMLFNGKDGESNTEIVKEDSSTTNLDITVEESSSTTVPDITVEVASNIKTVQQGYSTRYPDVTIEGGYKFALKDPKWSEFETEKGQKVIEVTGKVKNEDLKEYILAMFYDEFEIALTVEEQEFWERYPYIKKNEDFIQQTETAELENYIHKNLYTINHKYGSALGKYNMEVSSLASMLESVLTQELDFSDDDVFSRDDIHNIQDLDKIINSPKVQAVLPVKILEFKEQREKWGHGGMRYYPNYLKRKEWFEKSAYPENARVARAWVEKTQNQFEEDFAKAKNARLSFLKAFMTQSEPIITSQFTMHVDGKNFKSVSVEATLTGGPLKNQKLTLNTRDWEHELFSN